MDTLTQRVDQGELCFVNLRSVLNARDHPIHLWAKDMAIETLAHAKHVDWEDGALWIDRSTLRQIQRRHRVPLDEGKRRELAEVQARINQIRRREDEPSKQETRALSQRVRELMAEQRGYRIDLEQPDIQHNLRRAWQKHLPVPTRLPGE